MVPGPGRDSSPGGLPEISVEPAQRAPHIYSPPGVPGPGEIDGWRLSRGYVSHCGRAHGHSRCHDGGRQAATRLDELRRRVFSSGVPARGPWREPPVELSGYVPVLHRVGLRVALVSASKPAHAYLAYRVGE